MSSQSNAVDETTQLHLPFFSPREGLCGDVIPFAHGERLHLFYLNSLASGESRAGGMPWKQIVTDDLLHGEDWGTVLESGVADAPDFDNFTGCVVEHDGRFHILYTGNNGTYPAQGKPAQVLLHAESDDLQHWRKTGRLHLTAPDGLEPDDWRDPFVFWHDEEQCFWMLVCARKTSGPLYRRGVVALLTSPDLFDWTPQPHLWEPDMYQTLECPDMFRMGDWWYLVYSTFSDRFVTHYRMAKSPRGPWFAPRNEMCDDRNFYAAKTVAWKGGRYLFGWIPFRKGGDSGGWGHGGTMAAHQLHQQPDGTLVPAIPDAWREAMTAPLPITPKPYLGTWSLADGDYSCDARGRFSALSMGDLPEHAVVEVRLKVTDDTRSVGLFFHAEATWGASPYLARLDPSGGRLSFDSAKMYAMPSRLAERDAPKDPDGEYTLVLHVHGDYAILYVGDVALSCRVYLRQGAGWGLFVEEGVLVSSRVSACTDD